MTKKRGHVCDNVFYKASCTLPYAELHSAAREIVKTVSCRFEESHPATGAPSICSARHVPSDVAADVSRRKFYRGGENRKVSTSLRLRHRAQTGLGLFGEARENHGDMIAGVFIAGAG